MVHVKEDGALGRVEDRVAVLGELEGEARLAEGVRALSAHVEVHLCTGSALGVMRGQHGYRLQGIAGSPWVA